MNIAAAYIRVSTDDQTELSPDSQIKQIQDYAKSHDMILSDKYIYRDDGISGRKAKNRPEFIRMISDAKQKPKPFDVILVWKFSRFARNREDSIVYKSMLKKQGIDVISISEPVGDDKMSVLMEAMIEAMDEYYSLNLSEEATRGMLEKLSRGKCVNSAPLGYCFKDGELIINEDHANIIKRIYAEFLSGKPMLQIARGLNADNIRTRHGKQFENRNIEYILRNPLYCGKLRFTPGGGGSRSHYHKDQDIIIVQGTHEPIIQPDIWEQAQAKISEYKTKYSRYARTNVSKEYMLHGLVRCSSCGGSLTFSAHNGLQCCKYIHGFCSVSHYVTIPRLSDAVIEALKAADFDGEVLLSPPKIAGISYQDNAEKLLQREYSKLERIKEAYAAGIDTLDEYKEQKLRITAEIERLKSKVEKKPDKPSTVKRLKAQRKQFLDLLKSPETTQKALNDALRAFVDKIIYDKASETITIFYSA